MIVNINTFSDAGFVRDFTYLNASLAAIDLTGNEFRMHVRARADEATVFLALSSADGDVSSITFTDAINGKFRIAIPYKSLLRLPVGTYVHSLIRKVPAVIGISSGVDRDEIWRGTLTHSAGPTRWV